MFPFSPKREMISTCNTALTASSKARKVMV
jgi:hypothetical protein